MELEGPGRTAQLVWSLVFVCVIVQLLPAAGEDTWLPKDAFEDQGGHVVFTRCLE